MFLRQTRAEIALMSGSAFAVTHHAFSSGAGRTSDGNGSHASTLKITIIH
ncbi:putative IS1 encoded protein [Shigella boydii 4444-74]|uniref:Putative IS1 encoded protein n=1 Tax=Shigella boydii 4444-74 TaxID=766140 RepID=I6DH14_SHIBO|nr:putative IS1 encoded protein [Shigella boydii 4444-74]